jgi:hypothetical protein
VNVVLSVLCLELFVNAYIYIYKLIRVHVKRINFKYNNKNKEKYFTSKKAKL